jgi:hypothetical protein
MNLFVIFVSGKFRAPVISSFYVYFQRNLYATLTGTPCFPSSGIFFPPFSVRLSGHLSVHAEDRKLASNLKLSVLNVVLIEEFFGKI